VKTPVALYVGLGVFVLVLIYIVGSSLTRRSMPEFALRPETSLAAGGRGPDTLTVDATDERRWHFVDLDAGAVRAPPDTAGWDLAVRRYNVVPAGEAVDAGAVPYDDLARRPGSGYIRSTFGRDTANAAIARWYSYGMMSHLLEPNGHVYVVQTTADRYAKLEVLSYYCPGLKAGCLTFRFGFVD
jgi:hypothetical protein